MALFGSKKNKDENKAPEEAGGVVKKVSVNESVSLRDLSLILKKPHITEKASMKAETANVYSFEVPKTATKNDVKVAVKAAYNVKPVKVNMVNLPRKAVFIRGKWGTKNGTRKAYVYLKKGDKIEFV